MSMSYCTNCDMPVDTDYNPIRFELLHANERCCEECAEEFTLERLNYWRKREAEDEALWRKQAEYR